MTNVHSALGAYSNAVSRFEASAQAMLSDLERVEAAAAALPVQAHSEPIRAGIAALRAAVPLGLSEHYRTEVVPAAKGAAKGIN